METVTSTDEMSEAGPLTKIVLEWGRVMQEVASGKKNVVAVDFDVLSEYVAVDEFRRVGAYLEEQTWEEYVAFLAQWGAGTKFESTVFRMSEIGNTVFREIEERHYHGDDFIRKNVIAVYRFNDENKVSHLDIYEQARDSGGWIKAAAGSDGGN